MHNFVKPTWKQAAVALAATAALVVPVVALPEASIQAKEAALKKALFEMREAIDHYYADKKEYPRNLDALVSTRYIARIPIDPFTNRARSWRLIRATLDRNRPTGVRGIYDVKSGSGAVASDGKKYSDW